MRKRRKVSLFRIIVGFMAAYPAAIFVAAAYFMVGSCAPKGAQKCYSMAVKSQDANNSAKAYKYYTMAINADNTLKAARWSRAVLGMRLDSVENSIDDYTAFIGMCENPDSLSTAYYNRGEAMWRRGYRADACSDWEECVNLNKKEFNQASERIRNNCKQ